jgi:hypothetical protein
MEQSNNREVEAKQKEPYIKPDFRYERVFAVQALQCGKVNSTQEGCHQSTKSS